MISVFVPAQGSELEKNILPKSGIVGSEADDGRIRVDFEGNELELEELEGFADRVERAAARHTWGQGEGYPTSARAVVDSDDLVRIGTFDPLAGTVEVTAPKPLRRWLQVDSIDDQELQTSDSTPID